VSRGGLSVVQGGNEWEAQRSKVSGICQAPRLCAGRAQCLKAYGLRRDDNVRGESEDRNGLHLW